MQNLKILSFSVLKWWLVKFSIQNTMKIGSSTKHLYEYILILSAFYSEHNGMLVFTVG